MWTLGNTVRFAFPTNKFLTNFRYKYINNILLAIMAPAKLAYWKIRGLAQSIRTLLGYTQTEFEDIFYEVGDAPDYDRSCWFNEKPNLGLDFPNLPYFLDGDIKITQSNAILRYLARKNGLDGETEAEKIRVDLIENQAMDFRNGFTLLCYYSTPDNFEAKCAAYREEIKNLLKQFNDFINGRRFFASDKITFVDFIMYELLDQHRLFQTDILEPFENLKNFMKNFECLALTGNQQLLISLDGDF